MDPRPPDFDRYWQDTVDALAGQPARPQLEPLALRSTEFATCHGVRLTSVGPYRLFGYLSIPAGRGPFPAIYYAPKYQSVLEIIPQGTANRQRSRYVTFALAARGQRNSDAPYAAMFPGLLTDGIDRAESYVFRGIAADAARGLQFLLGRPEVDRGRVAVVGNDLALIAAALAPGATQMVTTPQLFHDAAAAAPRTRAYPLEELNDYQRAFPARAADVRRTLAYFELASFAPRVTAATLIMAGAPGSVLDAESLASLSNAVAGPTAMHASAQSTYKDGLHVERWLAELHGIADLDDILPEHWRQARR